jgi:hypothetical protein
MPTLSYLIFNKHLPLTKDVIKQFVEEIDKLYKRFKKTNDLDNINVLKNKLESLL